MGSLVPVHPVAVTIGFHVIRESYVCSLAWHGTDAEASIFREPSAFARIMTRSNSAKEPKSVGFGACDSPLEGAGFEPSVPRERVCAFRDHVNSLQSVRHPLCSKWYVDYSDGTRPFGLDIHG